MMSNNRACHRLIIHTIIQNMHKYNALQLFTNFYYNEVVLQPGLATEASSFIIIIPIPTLLESLHCVLHLLFIVHVS